MASLRHYGHRRPHQQIVEVLREERGRQHDGYVTDRFLEVVERSQLRAAD
jgi:response regulator RpfG family c-di-GMP phosphodiesterase